MQLALIRDLGRTLRAGEVPTEAVIAVVAEQLDIDPAVFTLYAQREETRQERAREIVSALGLSSVRVSDYRMLIFAAEAMAYRASGLNLVVNAIVLWNTVYLSRVVDYVRSQGIIIPEELLSSVAPLPWGHISLTGDYLWNEIDRPLERYRPVRTKRFNPKNFTFP
ncbi:Tn3 family transposase [Photorhabdus heterorhabditis subsp. aluminescens]|nr:Tn3 family transposase [Photorhabdus heterorhabditis subsp. aluminescens]